MTSATSVPTDGSLLDALLDSWRRNNTIHVNLLRALPEDAMDLRAVDGSPTVRGLFMHMHYCRLVFVHECTPELGVTVFQGEWRGERGRGRIAAMLNEGAGAMRNAVVTRLQAGVSWTGPTTIRFLCCSTSCGTRATITARSSSC